MSELPKNTTLQSLFAEFDQIVASVAHQRKHMYHDVIACEEFLRERKYKKQQSFEVYSGAFVGVLTWQLNRHRFKIMATYTIENNQKQTLPLKEAPEAILKHFHPSLPDFLRHLAKNA